MRTTKHTPGPWHVIADPVYKGKHSLHDARYVATCDESAIETYTHGPDEEKGWRFDCDADSIICTMPDSENQKADARLIASAPALLEALKGMLRWAQDCAVDTVTTRPNAIPECIAAKQAIAQAEGQ